MELLLGVPTASATNLTLNSSQPLSASTTAMGDRWCAEYKATCGAEQRKLAFYSAQDQRTRCQMQWTESISLQSRCNHAHLALGHSSERCRRFEQFTKARGMGRGFRDSLKQCHRGRLEVTLLAPTLCTRPFMLLGTHRFWGEGVRHQEQGPGNECWQKYSTNSGCLPVASSGSLATAPCKLPGIFERFSLINCPHRYHSC